MGEKKPRKAARHQLKANDPDFIGKFELARHLGVKPQTIDKWIMTTQSFPPPHSKPGLRYAIWLRRHYVAYRETGRWPQEAYGLG